MIEQVLVIRGVAEHKFPSNKISSLVSTSCIVIDAFEKAVSFSAVVSSDDCWEFTARGCDMISDITESEM